MSTWESLESTALLGTARRPFDEDVLDRSVRELLPDGEPASRLLDAAALLTVARSSGADLLRPAAASQELAAVDDPRPQIPDPAAEVLTTLLGGRDVGLLVEFLHAVADRGLVLPAEFLPRLVHRGTSDRAVAAAAAPVLGERGRWLAGLRPDWRAQAGWISSARPADPADWDDARPADRRTLLRTLRREDPELSRDLLRRSWSALSPDEHELFVAELVVGLGPGDVDVLELGLSESRRATRDRAVALLARLPESEYARRVISRVEACVRPGGRGLVVEPPAETDAQLERDVLAAGAAAGIEERTEGVRAHWLRRLVAATPLTHWSERLSGSAVEVLRLSAGTDWRNVLIEGWSEAAVRQQNPEWVAALIRGARPPLRTELLGCLDAESRGRIVADLLPLNRDVPWVTGLLTDCPAPWTPALGRAVLSDTLGRQWPKSQEARLRERLEVMARRLPVELANPLLQYAARPLLSDAVRAIATRAGETLTARVEVHRSLASILESP